MPNPPYEKVVLPQRRAIVTTYSGPKGNVGKGIQPLAAWVGTYYADRVGDITVYFAERPQGPEPPTTPVQAKIFFEVDDDFHEGTKLPPDLKLERLPSQTVLYNTYTGPLTGLGPVMGKWLLAMQGSFDLKPGFWQRMLQQRPSPQDPGWEVEFAVIAA